MWWGIAVILLALGVMESAAQSKELTAAELSRRETPGSALISTLDIEEYEVRSAAEAMPPDKYGFRPAEGMFKGEHPTIGPAEVRTFGDLVKHIACANLAFAAEMDGQKPPERCDMGGPSPAKSKADLTAYLRDSFVALKKSIGAIDAKNMLDPIEGPYAGPSTRLRLAVWCLVHTADHYGQMTVYLRLNGMVPPASRPNPPELSK